MPYRKAILDYAAEVKMGLMTSWDIFRICRGCIRYGWKAIFVKPLFYQTGRIFPVPLHYEYLGETRKVWKNAFSVAIARGELQVGDYISVEFSVDYEEQLVSSLRIDNSDVQVATKGTEVGILWRETLPRIKVGAAVYRVRI